MAIDPAIASSVEELNYRVTVGDVAARAGIDLNTAQRGLLALASEAGGHLQVSESGDVAYAFPRNFQTILRNRSWRLRLTQTWQRIWGVLFYLIRISFGILLILSLVLILLTLAVIFIAVITRGRDDSDGGGRSDGPSFFFFPSFFWFDPFWIFYPDYDRAHRVREQRAPQRRNSGMNFLEAVFSFLFGDAHPNPNLEERRWQDIGAVIRANGGAVVAEQIAPYLDEVDEDEDFMLSVLTRFNGSPQVSPQGEIIYTFPDLQVTAAEQPTEIAKPEPYLRENPWRFSQAGSGQILVAIALGGFNFILALVLGNLLASGELAAQIGGLVAFVQSIYWIILGYAIAFLTVPLVRYFWIQGRNRKLDTRNQKRAERAKQLAQADRSLLEKLRYARGFAARSILSETDLAYTSERDLLEQESDRSDKIDEEWRRRLESGS